jgi:hypothetical protein
VICKGSTVALAAYGRVIHCRYLLWVLQVVGSNPAAPTTHHIDNAKLSNGDLSSSTWSSDLV